MSLRPVEAGDRDFLFALFEQTSERTFGTLDLPSDQKRQLLEMQFRARETGWRNSYPAGDFQLILVGKEPAGLWNIHEGPDGIVLIYAALVESFRGQGIAAALTRRLISQAQSAGKTLSAHVEVQNPAQEFWFHLGFKIVENLGAYYRIEHYRDPLPPGNE